VADNASPVCILLRDSSRIEQLRFRASSLYSLSLNVDFTLDQLNVQFTSEWGARDLTESYVAEVPL
jgi:hypothetical protein